MPKEKRNDSEDVFAEELIEKLKNIYENSPNKKDEVIGDMLVLTVDQKNPESNYKKLLEFLDFNPKANSYDVKIKIGEIIGLRWIDDDDDEDD